MTSFDPFEFAHRHRDEVVWMSQNTNTLPMHPAVLDAIRASVDAREFNLYPYRPGVFGLPEAVTVDLGVEDFDILLTNGGIEGEYIATRALLKPGDEVLATDPSFFPIHDQIAMSGAKPIEIDIYRDPYLVTPEMANEAVTPATKMLLLVDPNNPLGSGYSRAQVKGLCEIAEDHDLLLIDDVTYRDFSPDHALTTEFVPDRTLISYSLSKAAGLAGMRVGAILGPKDLLKTVRKFDTNVLGVNVVAQRAALAALRTKSEWLPEVLRVCAANQKSIRAAVGKVDGAFLPVYPAKANMFAIDVSASGVRPEDLESALLRDHLIHTRAGSYVSRKSGSKFLRVSFTISEEGCRRFTQAFPAAIEKLRA